MRTGVWAGAAQRPRLHRVHAPALPAGAGAVRLTAPPRPACPCRAPAVMEIAAGGSLTSYVADKWQKAQAQGLFLSEDEARYFFKVGTAG